MVIKLIYLALFWGGGFSAFVSGPQSFDRGRWVYGWLLCGVGAPVFLIGAVGLLLK